MTCFLSPSNKRAFQKLIHKVLMFFYFFLKKEKVCKNLVTKEY